MRNLFGYAYRVQFQTRTSNEKHIRHVATWRTVVRSSCFKHRNLRHLRKHGAREQMETFFHKGGRLCFDISSFGRPCKEVGRFFKKSWICNRRVQDRRPNADFSDSPLLQE
jgi:hypothetical protein